MKQWKCTVCGYIHKGDEPPEKCPVCGAERDKFVEIFADEPESAAPKFETQKPEAGVTKSKYQEIYDLIISQVSKHHLHPISVHIPNGVLPISVIFILLSVIFQISNLQLAAFYNTIFVVLAMPVVLFSGYVDWQKRYGGNMTTVFMVKMACGAVVTVTSLIVVIWQIVEPAVTSPTSNHRAVFVFIHLIMVAAAGVAGFFGGKLVFKD